MSELNICEKCKKEYKYLKAYEKHIAVCGLSENEIIEEPEQDADVSELEKLNEETLDEFTKETEKIDIEKKKGSGKKIDKHNFVSLCSQVPKFSNRKLKKFIEENPESEWRELAEIWLFDEEEITAIFESLYTIFLRFAPKVLVWMGDEGFFGFILQIGSLVMILGEKVVLTAKFFYMRSKAMEVSDVRPARKSAKATA